MKTINEILILVREEHLKDVEEAKQDKIYLIGLCTISNFLVWDEEITAKERIMFLEYLEKTTQKPLYKHIWSIDNTNTERLEYLNEHIELTK